LTKEALPSSFQIEAF